MLAYGTYEIANSLKERVLEKMHPIFHDLVLQQFDFLKGYGFAVTRELYHPEIMGNSEIVFASSVVGIAVILDRGQVLINIGPLSEPQPRWFEFTDVVKYFAPEVLETYIKRDESLKYDQWLDRQIKYLASIMRLHCSPILKGDFSMRDAIHQIENKRVAEMLDTWNRPRSS